MIGQRRDSNKDEIRRPIRSQSPRALSSSHPKTTLCRSERPPTTPSGIYMLQRAIQFHGLRRRYHRLGYPHWPRCAWIALAWKPHRICVFRYQTCLWDRNRLLLCRLPCSLSITRGNQQAVGWINWSPWLQIKTTHDQSEHFWRSVQNPKISGLIDWPRDGSGDRPYMALKRSWIGPDIHGWFALGFCRLPIPHEIEWLVQGRKPLGGRSCIPDAFRRGLSFPGCVRALFMTWQY